MTGEFKTSAEAARMLVELERVMSICVAAGPKSAAMHTRRMAEVCAERDRLIAAEVMAPWRVGRKVSRNLYRGDDPVAMLATPELAASIAAAMNLAERMCDEDPSQLSPVIVKAVEVFKKSWPRDSHPPPYPLEEISEERVKAEAEEMIAARQGEPCNQCGKTVHADGSRVTWLCASCKRVVCRDCALTVPGREPPEYYELTLCSRACWVAAGRPDD